jgi:hypothetical protein
MKGVQGIGGHTLPNKGATVTWLTGPEILSPLGSFDLDPLCRTISASMADSRETY